MDRTTATAEALRLEELRSFGVLDSEAEQAYDDVVKLASFICDTPIALISLIYEDRQWFKARVGMNAMETPRGIAFCAHAITEPHALMEVPDALDDSRFANNPLVTGEEGVRFYAGAPLLTPSGAALGTVCVIDRVPRKLTEAQAEALKALSRQVVQLLALRRANAELELLSRAHTLRQRELEETQRQLKGINEELSEQTLTDALTTLKNRRAFDRLLANEYARALRTRSPLALLMVWTTSKPTTTNMATWLVTRPCRRWLPPSSRRPGPTTMWPATEGRSLPSSCPPPQRPTRPPGANG